MIYQNVSESSNVKASYGMKTLSFFSRLGLFAISLLFVGNIFVQNAYAADNTNLTSAINAELVDRDHDSNFYLYTVLDEPDYTAESWQDFIDALGHAIAVEADENATQPDVEEAITMLEDAKSALVLIDNGIHHTVPPEVTADDIENTVSRMEVGMEYSLDSGGFISYDSNTFGQVDLRGEHTLDVRWAAANGDPATDVTVLTFGNDRDNVDFSAWELLHEQFQPQHQHHDDLGLLLKQEVDYTSGSWTVYIAAIQEAGSLFDNELDPTQTELDAAIQNLSDALAQLTPVNNPALPDAPDVSADDENNIIVGFAEGMEFNHIEEMDAWINWTENNNPTFDGDDTVWVRFAENGTTSASNITVLHFTSASGPIDKTALVSALESEFTTTVGDFGDLVLNQSDYTILSWNDYIQALINADDINDNASSTQLEIDNAVSVLADAKASLVLLNPTSTSTPAAPSVSINGGTAVGLNSTMEYSVDGGPFITYDANTFNALNLYGHTLRVRVAASGDVPAGDITTLVFGTQPTNNGGNGGGGGFSGGPGGYGGPFDGLGTLNRGLTIASVVSSPNSAVFGIGGPTSQVIFGANGQVLGASNFFFSGNLSLGTRSDAVLELQNYLASIGLFNGPFTGYYGRLTRAAVIAYQRANGLPATGFFGPLTRAKVNANASVTAQTVTANNPSNPNMNAGSLITSLEAAGIIDANQASSSRRFYGI